MPRFNSLPNQIMRPSKMICGNPGDIFIDSCTGLVCVGRPLFNIVLWNPTTNLWKTLPHSTCEFQSMETEAINEFFLGNSVSLGFGCNADVDAVCGYDYKVVRLTRLNTMKTRTGVEVYSSKTDSWKRIQVGFEFIVIFNTRASFFSPLTVNQTPYWFALLEGWLEDEDLKVFLLWFDCAKMEFKIVQMPVEEPESGLEVKNVKLVDWKRSLGCVGCMENADGWLKSIDVMVFEDGENVWKMKESYGGLKLQVGKCINASRSGKIFGNGMNGDFFVYNTEINHLAMIDMKGDCWNPLYKIFPYEECLAFVQGMKPMVVCKEEDRRVENINTIDGFFISGWKNPFWADIECHTALGG